jgi:hypothetical protein
LVVCAEEVGARDFAMMNLRFAIHKSLVFCEAERFEGI